jgi:CRISPR-associated protein Csb2
MTHLCITVKWLDSRYHGLLSRDGPPEWPPSPFRLFQALVAGVARRGDLDRELGQSLQWLEGLEPQHRLPVIITPRFFHGRIVTRFVPNNGSDKVLDRQKRLTDKTAQATIMLDEPVVHYVWKLPDNAPKVRSLIGASDCLSCLGWGIDMAYADGHVLDERGTETLTGVRWFPRPGVQRDDGTLRVAKEGSMADLCRAHKSLLGRITHGEPLASVHKPEVFDQVFYSSSERPLGRPYEIFALNRGGEPYRGVHAKIIHVAGMTRRESIKVMKPYADSSWVEQFVAGHRKDSVEGHEQFSYIPLPSIGHEHADAMIRRVMIAAPFGREDELRHLADQLDGVPLQPEGGGEGPVLNRQKTDGVTRIYVGTSRQWASVTPVILPGHDDHKPAKTMKLIERALRQSGIDQPCTFTWGSTPNFPHCLTAHKYDRNNRHVGYYRPDHLESLTAVHLRLTFEHPVTGPLSIGAGRHCGLGVLAAVS